MEITWEGIVVVGLVLIVGSFIAAFVGVAGEEKKREREQREREALQRRGN